MMTTRRTVLIAGTGAFAASITSCGGGAADANPIATPAPVPEQTPVPNPPPPPPPPLPSPSRAPPSVSGGSVRQLGTRTLYSFLTSVRTRLPEGLNAANSRLMPIEGILAFCGATIWRDKYSLGVAGGHADSFDDGHYAQDLTTGHWETLLLPSDVARRSSVPDANGEWIANRPASQHSYFHLVTVGDDILQGFGYAIGGPASGSQQAHRWNGASSSWERYGNGGSYFSVPHTVLHDAKRKRVLRFARIQGAPVDVIPDNDPTATWTVVNLAKSAPLDIYSSIGLHVGLDCFVWVDHREAPKQAWVMDPDQIAAGWVEVAVQGAASPGMPCGGMEYVPPMDALASASILEPDVLYYFTPTAGRFDAWRWSREKFISSVPITPWEVRPGGGLADPQGRLKWSALLNGLVTIKSSFAPTEVFTPSAVGATSDWAARSTAPGVVVAYDFSAPPANGGDWKWGSLKASPKITCWAKGDYAATRMVDTAIYPPGSTASLRWDVPSPAGEMADGWWISIDNAADQFGENSEFWVQWRTRMNKTYAAFLFADRGSEVPGTSGFKHTVFGEGMRVTMAGCDPTYPHGYEGPATNFNYNHISFTYVDFEGEIAMVGVPGGGREFEPSYGFKYPAMYHGKPGYFGLGQYGTDRSWFTDHNSGNESFHRAACEYQIGTGVGYRDKSTCFIYPTDEWFTLMIHVKLGPKGSALSSLGGSVRGMAAAFVDQTHVLMTGPHSGVDAAASGGLHVRIRGTRTDVAARVTSTAALLMPLADVSGTIYDEPLLIDQLENGYTESTIEYFGAYQGGQMQLLHRKSGIVLRVGNYPDGAGSSPNAKYGSFVWTTFMTNKSFRQKYPEAKVWVGQIIIKAGATPPAAPSI